MRFISMVKATKESEAGTPPDPKLMEAIGKSAMELMQSGKFLEMGGLLPSMFGARVKASGGKVTVVDGPFAEFKELIGGYAIFEVASKEEAVEIARGFMQLHIDVLGSGYEGECELRQMAPGTGPR